ncbi:MAG TPA: hypothetical protein VJL58_05175, partial [Pyrinomonadaceae bacterium]|nr:hypothetical protein [Pyrinomonadaceae bacterium]
MISKHNCKAFVRLVLFVTACGAFIVVSAQTSSRPDGMRFVPDVIGQVDAFTARPDAFGLHIGITFDPSVCKHYQGMVRVQGADGTQFFIVSRSGNLPSVDPTGGLGCNDSDDETDNGHLMVFRLGSRDRHGERLRSNRLRRDAHVNVTPPQPEDVGTFMYSVVDGGLVPGNPGGLPTRYGHPGGMQVIGDVLALAIETRESINSPRSLAMFLDVSDPEHPEFLSQFAPVAMNGEQLADTGTMAVTPLADGHYLMAITGGAHNETIRFYRSTSTNLKDPNLSWYLIDEWYSNTYWAFAPYPSNICEISNSVISPSGYCLSPDEQYAGQNWPDGYERHTHQTLQFLRQGDINGPLFLAGVRGKLTSDTSAVDVYRIDCQTSVCDSGNVRLRHMTSKAMSPFPNTDGNKIASFAAASQLYVSPSGELILYVTEHDNDGPSGTVKAGEWRQRDVVRPGSPTFLPTAKVNGPYEVDEGSSVMMTGEALPPITKAFVQLFHETNLFGLNPIFDYDDRSKDDYGNLFLFELQLSTPPLGLPFYHADKTRSLNWFAPPGCSIRARDFGDGTASDQPETLTLAGDGTVHRFDDLTAVLNDVGSSDLNQEIDAIEFLTDCDAYYNDAAFELRWDLNGNGSFDEDEEGSTVSFSAA